MHQSFLRKANQDARFLTMRRQNNRKLLDHLLEIDKFANLCTDKPYGLGYAKWIRVPTCDTEI